MEFDPEDEEAAMAAAMGFSSFGSHKPLAKKRKFNPTTDAFVEGQELEKLDRGGKKGTGSGGNTIPLGKMRVFWKPKETERANEDEIDLDADEEGGPQYEDTSRTLPAESISNEPRYMNASLLSPIDEADAEEEGPRYIDTSEEAPATTSISDAEKVEMQARIDAILSSIDSAPPPPGSETLPLHSISGGLPPPPGLPNRAAHSGSYAMQGRPKGVAGGGTFSDTASMASSGVGRGGVSHRSGRGQYNEKWYEGYYDPSFNENPWAKLEKAKGLEPVGTWIDRPEREGR